MFYRLEVNRLVKRNYRHFLYIIMAISRFHQKWSIFSLLRSSPPSGPLLEEPSNAPEDRSWILSQPKIPSISCWLGVDLSILNVEVRRYWFGWGEQNAISIKTLLTAGLENSRNDERGYFVFWSLKWATKTARLGSFERCRAFRSCRDSRPSPTSSVHAWVPFHGVSQLWTSHIWKDEMRSTLAK